MLRSLRSRPRRLSGTKVLVRSRDTLLGTHRADRAFVAAVTRLLPVRRRLGLLVAPATILRWHRQLVARRRALPDLDNNPQTAGTGRRLDHR